MLKKWMALILCLAAVLSLTACSSGQADGDQDTRSKVKVSVTFNALYEFTKAVGGDKVEITTIIPDGTEPHAFEPKAKDLVGMSGAQVFVYNGFGMESWAEQAVTAADNDDLITVEASSGATPITNTDEEEIEEHGQYDPHLWLSIKGAEIEVANIRDGLIEADPDNKDYYNTNCDDYIKKLEDLYDEYNEKFESVTNKSFVTGHAAFAYFCQDFGLSQNSVEDVFAEGEPSAQQLTNLVEYCRENNVTTIFAEEMVSPEVSETLANEIGASVETIYTMASSEGNMTYLERMEDNLSKIYDSLSA